MKIAVSICLFHYDYGVDYDCDDCGVRDQDDGWDGKRNRCVDHDGVVVVVVVRLLMLFWSWWRRIDGLFHQRVGFERGGIPMDDYFWMGMMAVEVVEWYLSLLFWLVW